MGGFHRYNGEKPDVYLLPHDVIGLVRQGVLIPPSEEEIKDHSKGDSLSKIDVIVQTL